MQFKFFRISTMSFNFFPSLIISNIPFKYEQIKSQTKEQFLPFPWLTITLFSSSLYAISSAFDPLSFLLTSSALILSILAFAFFRAISQLKASLIVEEEVLEEEEEEKDTYEYSCDDSLLSTSCDETSASEETDGSEWTFRDDPDQDSTRECSDGSISDEESLIELDPKKSFLATKCGVQHKYWSPCYYSMEPFQRQQSMDLLADEENMIEIDLAVGSIKCPRLDGDKSIF